MFERGTLLVTGIERLHLRKGRTRLDPERISHEHSPPFPFSKWRDVVKVGTCELTRWHRTRRTFATGPDRFGFRVPARDRLGSPPLRLLSGGPRPLPESHRDRVAEERLGFARARVPDR